MSDDGITDRPPRDDEQSLQCDEVGCEAPVTRIYGWTSLCAGHYAEAKRSAACPQPQLPPEQIVYLITGVRGHWSDVQVWVAMVLLEEQDAEWWCAHLNADEVGYYAGESKETREYEEAEYHIERRTIGYHCSADPLLAGGQQRGALVDIRRTRLHGETREEGD